MGHLGLKNEYKRLTRKLDSLYTRSPINEALYDLVKVLYTPEEADLIAKLPGSLSPVSRIARVTGYEETALRNRLEQMADKGLLFDLWVQGEYYYSTYPIMIGVFETTMMRTKGKLEYKEWAKLLDRYLREPYFAANYGDGQQVGILRALPYEESLADCEATEILDSERATAIVETSHKFSLGMCACRHEREHIGDRRCTGSLNICGGLNWGADYFVRHGMAREVSKSEMLENIARSKELGLVLSMDNVENNGGFLCSCCKCCCIPLRGIREFGYAHPIVSSNYLATCNEADCTGCGDCAEACPIDVIEMRVATDDKGRESTLAHVNEKLCLGCGVCASRCSAGAMRLIGRSSRVLHPASLFERVILSAFERGNLQNTLFDDPSRVSHRFLRAFVGGFLRLPTVKRALISDALRSRFLTALKGRAASQGKKWLVDF